MRKLLIRLGVAFVLLLGLEGAVRVLETVRDDLRTPLRGSLPKSGDWSVPSSEIGWRLRPSFEGHVWDIGRIARRFDADGHVALDTEQIADTTRPKVVFIGDSNTFGWGNPPETAFPEVVDELLPDVDAINLAVPGYSSYQGKLVLERALAELHPSAVVVSFNFNDRRYVLGTPDGPERFASAETERATARRRSMLERVHLFRAARRLAERAGLIEPADWARETATIDELVPRVGEEDYRRNLSEMAEMARAAGVPLVLLLLNDSPIESYHLREGLRLLDTDSKTAVRHLSLAARVTPSFLADLGRVVLVEAHRARGQAKKAEDAAKVNELVLAYDGGGAIRLDSTYNDVMREVADEYGAPLVEGGRAVDEDPGDYIDMCHFDAAGHRRVAEVLAPVIEASLGGGSGDE